MKRYRSTSAADVLTPEQRDENRFLRRLKAVLRRAAASAIERDGITYEMLAHRLGIDPAQLSRALSPDRHVTSKTMWKILRGFEQRWVFDSEPLLPMQAGKNEAYAASTPSASHWSSPTTQVASAAVPTSQFSNAVSNSRTATSLPTSLVSGYR